MKISSLRRYLINQSASPRRLTRSVQYLLLDHRSPSRPYRTLFSDNRIPRLGTSPLARKMDSNLISLAQNSTMSNFPTHRLRRTQTDPARIPLVLVACGSFSPITYLHLRMFEMAADFAKFNSDFEIMGGYFSPVGDAYAKKGLASARHRLAMCNLAVDQGSNWLMVDDWEASQKEYVPTAKVLDHFEEEINQKLGGVAQPDGTTRRARILLLAGADLIQTMSTPGVWSEDDLEHILGGYGVFVVERNGTDVDDALASLQRWKDNIYVIQQLISNDISSTKIRMFLRREMSIEYLIPKPVIQYIEEHALYEDDDATSTSGKGKSKQGASGSASPSAGGDSASVK